MADQPLITFPNTNFTEDDLKEVLAKLTVQHRCQCKSLYCISRPSWTWNQDLLILYSNAL